MTELSAIFLRLVLAAAAAAGAMTGCRASPAPLLASRIHPLAEGEERLVPEFDPARGREVLDALGDMAAGRESSAASGPGPVPKGRVRWSDVPLAVAAACRDVEAVVVRKVEEEKGRRYRFKLRSVEDWPGELVVRRVDGPPGYTAEAWFGYFPEHPPCAARRTALLSALSAQLKAYGRKRGFDDGP